MNYKDVMDLWYVWMPVLIIIIKYVKGIVDSWND